MLRRPPVPTLFPYTTLFRSVKDENLAAHLQSPDFFDAERHPELRFAAPDIRLDGDGKDRKSTRLNSSHVSISYAVFCLKKKTRPPTAPRSCTGKTPCPRPRA